MSKTLYSACIFAASTLSTSVFSQDSVEGKTILTIESTYATFDQDNGPDSGAQWFTPLSVVHTTTKWDLGLKTAFIYSERDSSFAGGSGSVNTISDTVISGTYRAYAGNVGWLGDRRATLALNGDLNLPTGKEQLSGAEKNAVFDSFLVDQDRFGEGPNLGLGVSSTITLTEGLLLGLGASYNIRGEFNPDGDDPDRKLDPGNQIVVSTQLLHAGPKHQLKLGYRVIDEHTTEVDDVGVFDRALSHEIFGVAAYRVNDSWSVRASGLYALRGKDDVFDTATGRLVAASEDNNGDTYYASVGASYHINEASRIGLDLSRRFRGENEFDEANFSFDPSLTRDEIELTYSRAMESGVTLDVGVSYFEVEEGNILGFEGPRFDGFTFSLGARYAF